VQPGDRNHREEILEALEVVRVGGEQRKFLGDRDAGDHQVGDPTPWRPARSDDRRTDPSVDPGRVGIERDRVELGGELGQPPSSTLCY
jgi:hypothetical protein